MNGSYSFNNSVVYVPPKDTSSNTVSTGDDGKMMGMDSMDFTILLICVCGGGSLILLSIGVCAYCWIKRKKQRAENHA